MNRKIFLLLAALLTAFSASAYITHGGICYNVQYNPMSGKYMASVTNADGTVKYSGDKTIPSSFSNSTNNYVVSGVEGNAFWECTELNSVTIPSISVRQGAFGGCTGLTAIYGSYATEDNRCWIDNGVLIAFAPAGLTEFAIPDGVTSIGQLVFYNCTDLQTISIPEGVTEIGAYAFANCTGLTSITIPEGVTKIGANAFAGCTGLTSITIPEGVTTIGAGCFAGCTNMTINLPNSVTTIGESAFAGCSNMTITIDESVTSIGNSAFKDCTDITVNFNATNCTTIGSYKDGPVFEGCTNATLNIGDNVQTLPSSAFSNSDGLTSLTIGTGLQTIPSSAFEGCTSLTDVKIPDTVSEINACAFKGCTNLKSINIPEGITDIKNEVFRGCSSLTSITIPESVLEIWNHAFAKCTGLTSITIPEGVVEIATFAFWGCTGLTTVNYNATNCISPTDYGSSIAFPFQKCTNLTTLNIGSNVQSIPSYLFKECTGLTSVVIPESVTLIGTESFYGCTNLGTVINYSDLNIVKGAKTHGYVAYYAKEVIQGVRPESVTLSSETINLKTGESAELTATVLPANTTDKTVTWTSSDVTVATVDEDGNVTAIGVGTATITATCGDVSQTCDVVVSMTPTGIETLSADEAGREVEVFTLQGVKVADKDLAPGVYIRRVGDKAEKVLIK